MAEKKNKPARPIPAASGSTELSPTAVWIILGGTLLLGLFLRINGLTADSPRDLTWSLSPYTDEGFMVQNARNKLLFGNWLIDDFFRMAVSPLFSVIMYINFKFFGYGFAQARMVSVFFGLGSVLLTFFILRREISVKFALLGSLLASTSYLWVMQNRLALEESALMFFILLSIFFWTMPAQKNWPFFAAGAAAGTAIFFVKLSGLFFAPVLVLEALRQKFLVPDSPLKEKGWKPLLLFSGGFLLMPVIWVFTVLLPFGYPARLMVEANTIKSEAGKPENLGVFLRNIITLGTGDRLSVRAPFIFLLACWGLLAWAGRIKENLCEKRLLSFIVFAGFCTGTLMLSLTNYHPLRYQMIFLSPAIFLATIKAAGLWEKGFQPKPPTFSGLLLRAPLVLIFAFNLIFAAYLYILNNYQTFAGLVSSLSSNPEAWFQNLAAIAGNYSRLIWHAAIFGGLGLAAWWVIARWRNKCPAASVFPARLTVVLILFFCLVSDFLQYSRWSETKTYQLVELSRDLRNLPPGSLVAGPWSSSATIETPVRALPMQVYLHKEKVLERFPVTHLLLFQGGWETKFFQETYPDVLAKSKILKAYPIAGANLYLVELPPKSS